MPRQGKLSNFCTRSGAFSSWNRRVSGGGRGGGGWWLKSTVTRESTSTRGHRDKGVTRADGFSFDLEPPKCQSKPSTRPNGIYLFLHVSRMNSTYCLFVLQWLAVGPFKSDVLLWPAWLSFHFRFVIVLLVGEKTGRSWYLNENPFLSCSHLYCDS